MVRLRSRHRAFNGTAGPKPALSLTSVALLMVVACGRTDRAVESVADQTSASAPRACDADAATEAVTRFGERLRLVSTTAPRAAIAASVREHYADVVTPDLLEDWLEEPGRAPGREVSSPWPERIEVHEIYDDDDGDCVVVGEIVYVTSADAGTGGVAAREPVVLNVERASGGRWLVDEVDRRSRTSLVAPTTDSPAGDSADAASGSSGGVPAPPVAGDGSPTDIQAAIAVIRRYYDAISAKDYRTAYLLWRNEGARSGQTLDEFSAGFAETESVAVEIGEPGPVEGAVGNRYIEIPVEVRATTTSGTEQRYTGTFTLQRSVVDGATPEQRQWRITEAEIRAR